MDQNDVKIVRSVCRICYDTCGILIHLKNGIPFKIEGDPENPMSKGVLCPKGYASLEYLNHPDRLKYPMKRVGKRGEGLWDRISWDDALERVAQGLNRAKERYGVLSTVFIRGASKGLSDDLLARFANLFGSPNITSPAPYCFVPGARGAQFTYGYYSYADYDSKPRVILLWGVNPTASNPVDYREIKKAQDGGAKLIVVDPLENELTKTADVWIRLRPGTDVALCLGMINVIIHENRCDDRFIEEWTTGFDELKRHVKEYSPEAVEKITWVPAEKIRESARIYASLKPGLILWGNGIETNINSFQACRAIAILRSISGNIGIPGGDVNYSMPGGLLRGDPEFLCQSNIPPEIREKRLSKNDGILPINYYTLPHRIVQAILNDDPYPVRAAYVQAANILTHWPNANKSYQALQNLDFLAVADQFMTPTAEMADVVLPAASYLEVDSVEQPWHYPIASAQQKVAKMGESWADGKILNELLKKIGFSEYAFKDMGQLLDTVLKPAGVSFEEFRTIGHFTGVPLYRHYEREGFKTDSHKVELYSRKLEDWGYDPLPVYHELPETMYSNPLLAKEYPFILATKKADVYRHSGGRQIASLREKHPVPVVRIHPQAAARLKIQDGDWVYIATKRGKIEQQAQYCDALDPRVVEVDYAWWFPEESGNLRWQKSNCNILIDDESPYNREMGSPNMRGILCSVWKKEETP